MTITIFLDEAGDLGFDFKNKSPSTHFCITLLVCKNKHTLFKIKSAVKKNIGKKTFFEKI